MAGRSSMQFGAHLLGELQDLRAQVARKDAALRSFRLSLEAAEKLEKELGYESDSYMVSLAFSREEAHKMCAALPADDTQVT